MKEKIAVAMSGGIDSSFVAYLLVEAGYDVVGLHMDLPVISKDGQDGLGKKKFNEDLAKVCDFLKIPYVMLDYKKQFSETVIKYFGEEYQKGRTPNPCVVCNKNIKFDLLLNEAKSMGSKYLATGHYAKIYFDENRQSYFIKKALDLKRDQSYFLSFLNQTQLANIKFPLGDYTKENLRIIAEKIGIPVYNKSDSQEICFVPDNEYRDSLKDLGIKGGFSSGDMVLSNGTKVGTHDGIANYTIGQRKGLGAHSEKMYVKDILAKENVVVIGTDDELFSDTCIVSEVNINDKNLLENLKSGKIIDIKARVRYKSSEKDARIKYLSNGNIEVVFLEKQRAITKGQAIVFYEDDLVIGGGWIEDVKY